jgi:predicted RNA methylase
MLSELAFALRPRARRTYLAVRRTLSSILIEQWTGTETSSEVDLQTLGIAADGRVRYEPSGWLDLRRILRPEDVDPGDVFADFGSGKGRVVIQAARHPFKRVIGVELSAELTAIARANVSRVDRRRRCQEIELVTEDVLDFRVPDDLTVAYVYNPFKGAIFEGMLDNLIESVDRAPRTLRLIYRTPLEHERIMATGRFRLQRTVLGFRPGRAWAEKMSIRLYVLEPRAAASTEPCPPRGRALPAIRGHEL